MDSLCVSITIRRLARLDWVNRGPLLNCDLCPSRIRISLFEPKPLEKALILMGPICLVLQSHPGGRVPWWLRWLCWLVRWPGGG